MSDTKPGVILRKKKTEAAAVDATANAPDPQAGAPESAPAATGDADAVVAAPAAVPEASAAPNPAATPLRFNTAKAAGGSVSRPSATPEPTPVQAEERVPVGRPDIDAPMPTTDDFAAMFGDDAVDVSAYDVGDKVTATVAQITNDAVFVALGAKSEGVMERGELVDRDGNLTVAEGQQVEAWVVGFKDGAIRLSSALRQSAGGDGPDLLAQAAADGIPVEGRVSAVNKGGYDVEIMGRRGFCPHSQIALGFVEDPEVHVGNTYTFKVTRVDDSGRNVVVSRSALLQDERDRIAAETRATLHEGAVLNGTVSRIADFGAFVDLGGIDGLVHVSELGWTRYDSPAEVLKEGQLVTVKVLRIEDTDKGEKIALSMKALEEDPFVRAARQFQVGRSYTGRVTRMEPFGAFVELVPGFEGLCHISEIAHGKRINHPQDVLTLNGSVQVQILDMDPRKRQISLSMKRLMDDPWGQAASVYKPGQRVQGTVDSVQSFGVFVELGAGLMALIPLSQLEDKEQRGFRKAFKPGETVEATVIKVDAEQRRLTLSRREDADAELDDAVREYQQASSKKEASLGTFADLLKKL